jgi:Amino acid permease
VVSGSALAKYMILAVALSALGSTLASLVSGVRVIFAMGSDGVLPRQFGKTDSRFKTPVLATVIIGAIPSIGVWLYTFGSSSVQDSSTTVVSVDGLLFALYYGLTGIATAVYYRKFAVSSPWTLVQLAVFPPRRGRVPGLHHRAVGRRAGRLERQGSRLAVRHTRDRRGGHALRAVQGRGRTISACRGRPTSPPPNQPWPQATQRRPDLTGHAQKHLSGYRHPCLNPPPASFLDRGPQCGYCRHRAASKPTDGGAGQVGGETGRSRRRPPWL